MGKALTVGEEVQRLLVTLGIETPMSFGIRNTRCQNDIAENVRRIMESLRLNLQDDSLRDTPDRVAKMYTQEVFWGLDYGNFPKITTIDNTMQYDEVVHQRCTVMSLCEHHFVPFTGIAHVGYIPHAKVIGLSKINRIVDFFSRRPQVQERLTAQVSATLQHILESPDIAVVIRAEHMCVKLRGIRDTNSYTTTSKMSGRFLNNAPLRNEFLMLTK